MAYATILPAAPMLDPAMVAAVGQTGRAVARTGGFVLGSLAAAAVVWLMLAGPGFLAHGGGAVRVVRVSAR